MPYPALVDRVVNYNGDGSVVKVVTAASGVIKTLSAGEMDELNDEDQTLIAFTDEDDIYIVIFLADAVEVKGIWALAIWDDIGVPTNVGPTSIEGSNNTMNGIDGSWTAGTSYTPNTNTLDFDSWRKSIATVDFGGVEYATYRVFFTSPDTSRDMTDLMMCHLYGLENATPTAEADLPLAFIDPDDGDARFELPVNFGDLPAGTSDQKTFKIQNNHATDQATTISLDVTDPDDIVRISDSNGGPWVTTFALGNLASGAKSIVMYIKSEPAAPPTPLEPERAYIEVTVGSWV